MKIPQSRFQMLGDDLLEKVRRWRNQPRIRRNMLSTNEISPEEQARWFAGLLHDPSRRYLVFFQDGAPIGMLYFTGIASDACSWGCYLGEEAVWPGSGLLLEIAALDYAFGVLKVAKLHAEVFEFNTQPCKMHGLFEYRLEGLSPESYRRDDGEYRLQRYSYLKDEWMERRQRILEKLPRQIQAAADRITFQPERDTGSI